MVFASTLADTDELMAIIEECLNNYASDVHLFQSPLTTWQVVKRRLPTGIASTPEQLAATVRTVLDELIDSLQTSDSFDLNSASARRYIIADHLYRQGLKQSEICPARLPLSKSQFYRERTEILTTLANYIQRWEQRTVQSRKLAAFKALATLSPGHDSRLIGMDSLAEQITEALTSPDGPKLISLSGLGGLGKTALTQEVVARVLHSDQMNAIGWINCQRDRFTGTRFEISHEPPLTIDSFFNDLLRQLAPSSVSDGYLFELISSQVSDQRVTFDQVLCYLDQELEGREPSYLGLSEKRSMIIDLLWDVPTLIVVDGLEAMPGAEALIEELSQIASCTEMKVLMTSRTRFSECQYVKHFEITPVSEPDALQLVRMFGEEMGIKAVCEASLEDLRPIADAADGNPLIIKWIVNQLAAIPLRQVLSDLAQATGSARGLCDFIYRRAWETLSDSAQTVLMTIAQSPNSEVTWDVLLNSTGLRPDVLNRSLQELVASLLVPISASLDPSYQVSSVTRAFTLAECRAADS
jgi:NB-ARC domain-containing protein